MQPDAAGLGLATGVLAGVIGAFWFANRMISGPVADLSYTIGREIARGVAEWTASRPSSGGGPEIDAGQPGPGAGDGGDELRAGGGNDGDADGVPQDMAVPVLVRVTGGRPRFRIDCRFAAAV